MAAENSNKSNLKTNTSTRKSTLTLVNLPSFRISGETSPEKIYVENCKIYRRLYDWGYKAYPSHANVCKFFNFQHTLFSSADITPEMLKLGRVAKVKVLVLVLVLVFNLSLL